MQVHKAKFLSNKKKTEIELKYSSSFEKLLKQSNLSLQYNVNNLDTNYVNFCPLVT